MVICNAFGVGIVYWTICLSAAFGGNPMESQLSLCKMYPQKTKQKNKKRPANHQHRRPPPHTLFHLCSLIHPHPADVGPTLLLLFAKSMRHATISRPLNLALS